MNAAGEAQRQALARHRAAGAATQQVTAAAQEQFVHGRLQTPPVRHGHRQAQAQEIGGCQHKMR